jgi:hypothetical protein
MPHTPLPFEVGELFLACSIALYLRASNNCKIFWLSNTMQFVDLAVCLTSNTLDVWHQSTFECYTRLTEHVGASFVNTKFI